MIPCCRFTFFIYVNEELLSLIDENEESTFTHRKTKITFFLPCCDLGTSGKTQKSLNKQRSRWLGKGFLVTALQESTAITQAVKRSHRFLLNGSCLASQRQTGQLDIRGDNASNKQRHLLQLLDLPSSQGLLWQKTGLGWAATPSCSNTGILLQMPNVTVHEISWR